MSSKKSLVWTIWKRTKGFWETYLRGRRIMRWVIGSREERTIFPRQAWHRGRQELSSQMAKWRLLCCYFNSCSLHVKGYLDRWCASMSGHALPRKDPTSTRTSAQVTQLSAGQDEDTGWDCHLNTGPLGLLGSVKTAGLLCVSFELCQHPPKLDTKDAFTCDQTVQGWWLKWQISSLLAGSTATQYGNMSEPLLLWNSDCQL